MRRSGRERVVVAIALAVAAFLGAIAYIAYFIVETLRSFIHPAVPAHISLIALAAAALVFGCGLSVIRRYGISLVRGAARGRYR